MFFARIAMNVLKLLFNPIFLLAAGLHAGLLLIPIAGGSSDTAVPAPDPEGESITVTRIPPKTTSSVRPTTPSTSLPLATSRPNSPAVRQTVPGAQTTASQQAQARARQTDDSQPSQRSTSRSPNNRRRANNNTSTNSSNQTPRRDSANELTTLPSAPVNSTGNADTPEPQTVQAPPTLIGLKNGAQSREVPNILQTFLMRLRHSIRRTTEPEVEEAKQVWLANLEQQPGLEISSPNMLPQALEISYPLVADDDHGPRRFFGCLTPEPTQGLVGVIVEPDGTLLNEPSLLRSSGYGFLNDIALNKIQDYAHFPDTSTRKAYMVDIAINYDHDSCVNLAELKHLFLIFNFKSLIYTSVLLKGQQCEFFVYVTLFAR